MPGNRVCSLWYPSRQPMGPRWRLSTITAESRRDRILPPAKESRCRRGRRRGRRRGYRHRPDRVGAQTPGIAMVARLSLRCPALPYKAFPRSIAVAPSAVLECLPHERSHIYVSPGEAAKTNKFPQLVKKSLDGLDISPYSSKLQLFRSFADAPEGGKASWPKTKMLVRQYFIAIAARLRRFLTSWTCPTSSPFKRIVSNGS